MTKQQAQERIQVLKIQEHALWAQMEEHDKAVSVLREKWHPIFTEISRLTNYIEVLDNENPQPSQPETVDA